MLECKHMRFAISMFNNISSLHIKTRNYHLKHLNVLCWMWFMSLGQYFTDLVVELDKDMDNRAFNNERHSLWVDGGGMKDNEHVGAKAN